MLYLGLSDRLHVRLSLGLGVRLSVRLSVRLTVRANMPRVIGYRLRAVLWAILNCVSKICVA